MDLESLSKEKVTILEKKDVLEDGVLKKILSNLILSMSYYLINVLSNFWITSVVISILGKDAYSFYPLANNICGWMIIVSNAVNAMLARHMSIAVSKRDTKSANDLYSTAMLADLFIGLILLIPILIISIFPNMLFQVPEELLSDVQRLFLTVLMTVPVDMIFTVCSVTWTVKDKLHLSYIGRIIQCGTKLLFIIGCIYLNELRLSSIGYAILVADVIYALFSIWVKRTYMPEIAIKLKKFKAKTLKVILSSGIWNSLMQLGNSLLLQFDLIISNTLLGVAAAGTISIVATVPNAITSIVTLLSTLFLPMYYKDYAEKNIDRLVKDIQHAQFVVSGIICIGIVIFINFGIFFFDLWVPGNNSELLLILSVFYLCPLMISSMFRPVANACIAYNKMKFQAIMMVFNGILNVFLMNVWIRFTNMGLYAVVLSTCIISTLWNGFLLPIYVCKMISTKIINFYIVPIIVCLLIIVTTVICRILISWLVIENWFHLIVGCIVVATVCMLFWLMMYLVVKKKIIR